MQIIWQTVRMSFKPKDRSISTRPPVQSHRYSTALVLVSHGSRDRRAREAFAQFVRHCQANLAPYAVAGTQLELAELPLAEQILQVSQSWPQAMQTAIVVPVMAASGIHVREDIPAAVSQVQSQCPQTRFQVAPPLGQSPVRQHILSDRAATLSATDGGAIDSWVLWGHGSRLTAFAHQFEASSQQLAATLDCPVVTAYGMQPPSLETQVAALYRDGHRRIGIIPGLLFPGSLADRLGAAAVQLQSRYPGLAIAVAEVLMPHALWVEAVGHLAAPGAAEQQSLPACEPTAGAI